MITRINNTEEKRFTIALTENEAATLSLAVLAQVAAYQFMPNALKSTKLEAYNKLDELRHLASALARIAS